MPFYYSLFAAIIPMLLYLIIIWKLDKNEREPFRFVLKHFLWGAIGAIILAISISFFITSTVEVFTNNENVLLIIGAVLIAPVVEEITKGIFLVKSFRANYFDNITDGLVYGGAIGLGFGMTENLIYFISYDETFIQWATIVFTRSLFSAVMHGIASSTLGAFIAKAKFSSPEKRIGYSLIGLFLAISFHLVWNLTLTFEFTYWLGFIFMIVLIIIYLKVFKSSVRTEQKLIKDEFSEEIGLLSLPTNQPIGFYEILSSNNYFNDKKSKRNFRNFGTKLAFRKFQARNSFGKQQENYNADVEIYRKKIRTLLDKKIIT